MSIEPAASSPLVVVFAAIVALWPVAFIFALAYHSLAKHWRRVGQLALLFPLWSVAASVGLVQMPPLLAALSAPSLTRNLFTAGTAIAVALSCAVLAWALLIRSFGSQAPTRTDHQLAGGQRDA